MRSTGRYELLGSAEHFIPDPLPPQNPPLVLEGELAELYGECMLRLGQLAGLVARIPDQKRFIKAYVIKEALLTSAIEGIHTTLLDVFTEPLVSSSEVRKETQLVLNYTRALDVIMESFDEGLPVSTRVIRRAHKALLSGEGDSADPGNYRKQSVRVGALIPPPASKINSLMSDLERYSNAADEVLPLLIRVGLAHVQFETIHPFLDGNGRIGRLLIVMMLVDGGLLPAPVLYPSYFFKKHHAEYYMRLDRVRTQGDFEGWIAYYLKGIAESAQDAYLRAGDIESLEHELREKIAQSGKSQRVVEQLGQALAVFFRSPIISVGYLSEQLGKSYNNAHALIEHAIDIGILEAPSVDQKRNRLYTFARYIELLDRDR